MAFLKHGKIVYSGITVDLYSFDSEEDFSSATSLTPKYRDLDLDVSGTESILLATTAKQFSAVILIEYGDEADLLSLKGVLCTLNVRGEEASIKLKNAKRIKKIGSVITVANGYISASTPEYAQYEIELSKES